MSESGPQTPNPQPPIPDPQSLLLSIIIPTRNEASCLASTLERLLPKRGWEVIVADGGSSDGTIAIAERLGARVVHAPAGRGVQLDAGASRAGGDTLLFLHADTLLPDDFEKHVHRVLAMPGVAAGAFELRVDGPGRSLRVIERFVRIRSRWWQHPYGDQTLFLRAAMLRRVGGVPPLAAMEDYELVRRLRRLGRIEIAPAAVVTSDRRWRRRGTWRTTLLNRACVVAFRLGVSTARIARWRGTSGDQGDAADTTIDAGPRKPGVLGPYNDAGEHAP